MGKLKDKVVGKTAGRRREYRGWKIERGG